MLFLGYRRAQFRIDITANKHIGHEKGGKQDAGQDGTRIELADGAVVHQTINDQHDAGGNKDPQSPARQDGAAGDKFIVLSFEHLGKGNHAHGDFAGADDPHHGGHHGAGEHRGGSHTAFEP